MIRADGLKVTKGGARVLDGVTCAVPKGRLTVLIGPNGAGKSTLLRTFAGLEHVDAGRVTLGGQDVTNAAPHLRAKAVTWVPAEAEIPFAFTARECVVMGRFPWHGGLPTPTDFARADQALSLVGMDAFAKREVPSLSSGERLKIQVARALAGDAPTLLFDEPTANLDIGAALQILMLLQRIAADGRTIVASLHDLSLARRFAEHLICLEKGRVSSEGEAASALTPALLKRVFGVSATTTKTEAGADALLFDP